MEKTVIIVAGGAGTRMNAPVPKQFLLLAGRPLIMHCMQAFFDAIPGIRIIVALPENRFDEWTALCENHHFHVAHQLTPGGETRFHSVKNALEVAGNTGLIAIHDAARPVISLSLIRKVFEEAGQHGNCIPVLPVNESVRQLEGGASRPVDRCTLRTIQTPQVFRAEVLQKAYMQEYQERFTDDATVVENLGVTIRLTEGEATNIKVTRPEDLTMAEWLISRHIF